ncbi:MAG: exosortase/archaeosortase family protein [Myxococcales bacterium]|nr:exosortase/archaeosortase family protein [Myxococcales bacterium]MDH5306833.1 exosortase/archaeosortase family protein [Myxococcales bacterium]
MNGFLLRDLAWALLIGAMVAVSPHTSGQRLAPKLAGGLAAAALLVGYRVTRRRGSGEAGAASVRSPRAGSRPPIALWAVLLLLCAVFAPTALWLYGEWTESIWRNGHGLFIPLIVYCLARSILRREGGEGEPGSPWGFAFLCVGLALAVVGAAIPLHSLSTLGLVLCLPGLSLLLLGVRRTRALRGPLCLSLLIVPVPTSLAPFSYLPLASAMGAELILDLLGVPVIREASKLTVTGGIWFVSDRCSGFSLLIAALGAAVFLSVYCKSPLRRAALLLSVWPLVAIFNSVRTGMFPAVLEFTGINLLHTPLHGGSGIATFWGVMGAVFLIAGRQALREPFK